MSRHPKLTIRLHPQQDADLTQWLAELDSLPYGQKGEAIKRALRQGAGLQIRTTPATHDDFLASVRGIVEAAVASALATITVTPPAMQEHTPDETDALLDELGEQLML